MGSGGIGFTIGKQTVKTEADTSAVTHTGSTVGSLEGNVTLAAGNTLAITGSDVMALQGDITAKAKDIAITEVHDTSDSTQKTAFKQGGLTVSLSSAALNLAQAAVSSAEAGKKAQGDTRMQALAGASAAYSAYGAGQAASSVINADTAKGAAQAANVSIAVTVGGSKSDSETKQQSATSKGSTLQAGGNVNLIATGGGEDSNILVRGSDLKAGNNLLLSADHDITLEAAQDSFEQHSTSKSSSAAIGVAVTYGADGFAAGVTVSASGARGKADGQDITQRNSHLSAGKTATLISGNDTTLKGAVLSANTVLADIGGDLNVERLQDTSTYTSKDKAVGGSVTFGMGFSASGSYSSNKVNGDFASVKEQSGIQAGDGGFNLRVGGNTDLKGGVIASTQAAVDAGANRLQTGTLTVSDITNTSNYKATGISLSGGYAAGGSDGKEGAKTETQTPPTTNNGSNWSWQNQGSGVQGASAGFSSKSGSSTSTTASGISGGTVVITDQAGQQAKTGQSVSDVLAALNRDVHTGDSANGLVKGWDGQKLQQQVSAGAEITATFGQQASKAIGDYAEQKTNEAAAMRLQAANTNDPDQKAQLLAQADQLDSQWGANGTLRVLAHTAVGGLTGGVGGAAGAAAGTLTAPAVAEALRNAGVTGPLADALTGLASTAVGAVAGGASGAATAGNEVANNYLKHPQRDQKARELRECADEQCREKIEAKWDGVSLAQSREMKDRYFDSLTPEQQSQLLNLKPGTKEYDAILAQGVLQAASKTSPSLASIIYNNSFQLLTQTDWNGPQTAALNLMSLEDRNRVEIGVLGPLFGVPGIYATLFGATPEHVAVANQGGALLWDMGTAAEGLGSGVARGGKVVKVETRAASDLDNSVDGLAVITSNGQANSASGALYRKYLLASMSKPVVTDPELSSLIDDLYRDGAKIGSGSTADAVRYEMRTGEMVGGRSHSQKAQDYIRALQRWGNENDGNPNVSSIDKDYARKVIEDMKNALKGD
ncbi:hemagglutinin repeat-containing protein [Xanthomonas oryzae]|nr:hemagglutinin repeat-containing protein [Xanthomonas oryzae]UNE62697.1 hemagglutinin repeat-containing protein [Xanthomonas oryzae]